MRSGHARGKNVTGEFEIAADKRNKVNDEISAPEVRLINAERVNDLSPYGPSVLRTQGVGLSTEQFAAGVEAGTVVGHIGFPQLFGTLAEVGYDPAYGARPLKRAIQKRILDPLASGLLEGRFGTGDTVRVADEKGQLVLVREEPAPAVDQVSA